MAKNDQSATPPPPQIFLGESFPVRYSQPSPGLENDQYINNVDRFATFSNFKSIYFPHRSLAAYTKSTCTFKYTLMYDDPLLSPREYVQNRT